MRSGSFSKVMTSFPAHGGPPRTVENAERTNVRHATRVQDLSRTISDSHVVRKNPGPLHSSSLPEIGLNRIARDFDSDNVVWHQGSSAGDGFRRRGSLSTAIERNTQLGKSGNQNAKDLSYSSSSEDAVSGHNNLNLTMEASPHPFRRPLNNSFGGVRTKGENHERNNYREIEGGQGKKMSGEELARRLFHLEGFGRNEVAPMLFKK